MIDIHRTSIVMGETLTAGDCVRMKVACTLPPTPTPNAQNMMTASSTRKIPIPCRRPAGTSRASDRGHLGGGDGDALTPSTPWWRCALDLPCLTQPEHFAQQAPAWPP